MEDRQQLFNDPYTSGGNEMAHGLPYKHLLTMTDNKIKIKTLLFIYLKISRHIMSKDAVSQMPQIILQI